MFEKIPDHATIIYLMIPASDWSKRVASYIYLSVYQVGLISTIHVFKSFWMPLTHYPYIGAKVGTYF